jgi:hypothetical protein
MEPSVPFDYPVDPGEVCEEEVRSQITELSLKQTNEFALRLCIYLLSARDARLSLICVCYLAGFDMTKYLKIEKNSVPELARALGISRFNMLKNIKRVSVKLGMPYVHERKKRTNRN